MVNEILVQGSMDTGEIYSMECNGIIFEKGRIAKGEGWQIKRKRNMQVL